ncbi:NAD(P)-dependent alcohol dehydrogenase [Streptomyces sp. ODS28]|uniref:NAD(P)-dependent alcohol dehydrogenase n=1 Tax=Streptomyces sp. ODS28 TaxID=3136688 RepID=UPI0031F11A4C
MTANGTMRAALYDRYGGPEELYVGRVPKPSPGPGEVLVKVTALSVNGGELAARAGRVKLLTGRRFPQRVGLDFSGEVEATGSPMTRLRPGDRVWGVLPRTAGFGSAAEYVVVRPRQLAHLPEGMDPVEAAALPVGTTAITALRDKARLRPGERLLVRGASGGVGNVAVQLGRAYGARVTGLAGAGNLGLVRELGAHEAYDYRTTSPDDLGPFDVILDTVGNQLVHYSRLLTRGGRMTTVAFDMDHRVRSLTTILTTRHLRFFSGDPRHDLFADLSAYAAAGALRPVVDSVFPLEEIAEAHRALESGGVRGKHLVRV